MIGNSGLQMLEGNCGSDARSVYDLVKLLSRARSAKNDYTQKPWNTNSDELKLFSNIKPLHIGSEYQDPSFAIGSPSGQGGHLLKGNQFTKKSKRSGLNRRGPLHKDFNPVLLKTDGTDPTKLLHRKPYHPDTMTVLPVLPPPCVPLYVILQIVCPIQSLWSNNGCVVPLILMDVETSLNCLNTTTVTIQEISVI